MMHFSAAAGPNKCPISRVDAGFTLQVGGIPLAPSLVQAFNAV